MKNEKIRTIEEEAVKAVAGNIKAGMTEYLERAAAKNAGAGEFDLGTIEEIGLELQSKTNTVFRKMFEEVLSEQQDAEQVCKKKLN